MEHAKFYEFNFDFSLPCVEPSSYVSRIMTLVMNFFLFVCLPCVCCCLCCLPDDGGHSRDGPGPRATLRVGPFTSLFLQGTGLAKKVKEY